MELGDARATISSGRSAPGHSPRKATPGSAQVSSTHIRDVFFAFISALSGRAEVRGRRLVEEPMRTRSGGTGER